MNPPFDVFKVAAIIAVSIWVLFYVKEAIAQNVNLKGSVSVYLSGTVPDKPMIKLSRVCDKKSCYYFKKAVSL